MEKAMDDGDLLNPTYGPLSCSDETLKFLDLKGLSPENPSIHIEKEKLLHDINERLQESDFFIYKDCIENYPADSMLLVFDEHEKHGEQYYLCLTEEGKETVLSELNLSKEQEAEVQEEEDKNVEPELVNTEDEIEDERIDETKQKIQIILLPNKNVSRRSLELFSKMPSDHGELYLEILPESQFYDEEEEEEKKVVLEPIFRKTMDCGFQASVQCGECYSQTERCKLFNACTQTQLKLFTDKEKAHIWKSTEMESFLPTAEERILDVLIENSCGGLEKPWATLKSKESEIESGKDVPLTVSKSFICVGEKESKMITSIDWHPLFKDVFVAATAQNITFEEKTDNLSDLLLEPCLLYIWSFEDQLLPRLLLNGCDEIQCVKFNPTMPHIVVGGGVNGQLVLWDLSQDQETLKAPLEYDWVRHTTSFTEAALGDVSVFKSRVSRYCASTSIDHSHSLGAYHVDWIPAGIEIQPKGEVIYVDSSESYQIVSCGFDGFLRFWDMRYKIESPGIEMDSVSYGHSPYESLDMMWRPFHVVDVAPPEGQKRLSLTTFSLKLSHPKARGNKVDESESNNDAVTSISTVFFAGTEDGKVLQADFNLSKTSVGKHLAPAQPVYYTSVHGVHMHGGAVVKLAHSPFLNNVFISLGDKTAALWKEDFRKGPLFVDVSKSTITSGHWSPTRPAVFSLGLHDGSLRVWDILRSSRSPQLVQAVASAAITTITTRWISDDKQVLAVGDGDGFVHILELPKYLWKPMKNELTYVEEFVTREAKRVEVQNKKQIVVDMKKKRAAEAKVLESEQRKKEKTVEVVKEEKVEKSSEEKLKELLWDEYEEFSQVEQNLLVELGYLVLDEKVVDEEDNS